MVDLIKKWLEPPFFANNEEQSAQARTINTVQLYFIVTLITAAVVLIPLHVPRKSESYAILVTILLLNSISRYILFRGYLEIASTLMISVAWVLFVGIAAFSGGIASPLMFAVAATAIAGGLLINPRIGTVFVILSALAGLGIALLQQNGLVLAMVFSYSPIAAWFLFVLALVFVHSLMNLALNNLQFVLKRERRQNDARQQAEQALRQSEERFQMFMRYFPGLAYMKASDGQILFANQGFDKYLGLSPAEMIGKNSQAVFGTEFGEKINRDDECVLALGINQDIEEEFAGRKWMTHKFPINQPGGQPLLGGVTIDTTERKQAEEALRESEAQYRNLFGGMQELFFVCEIVRDEAGKALDFRYLDANPACLLRSQRERDEMVGHTFLELFPGNPNLGTWVACFERVILSGESEHFEQLTQGSGVSFEVFAFCPHPGQCAVIMNDITNRKRGEEKLRESEKRFKLMFEQAPIAINITCGTEITYANPTFLKIFGYSSFEELKERLPLDLFTPETRSRILENIQQRAQGLPVPNDYEAECFRKEGTRFPIHLYLTRTEFSDGPATVAFLLDITERRRAEEKIHAALEEKETLLREVHHRVKNNLQVIIALIRMQTGLTQDVGTQQFLKELEGQAHSMALVYEQLYQSENLSQIEMGPYLRQLTFNVLDTFGQKNSIQLELDAALRLDVAQAMPCGLIVNELFTNILKHAFRVGFHEKPSVKITMRQDGGTCFLTVSDNGVGLPNGYDWRMGQTLGLRLVNLWATHQLGGTLDVLAEAGTTFVITFSLDD